MEPIEHDGASGLAVIGSMPLAEVMRYDADECRSYLKKLDAVKAVLDAADRFRQNSVEFAKREALALIRLCEVGGINRLRGHRREAAKWLFSLRDEDRSAYIDMCSDGLTIEQIWVREVKSVRNNEDSLRLVRMYEKDVLKRFRNDGRVSLGDYYEHIDEADIPRDVGKMLKDGIRDKIRHAGGHGLGDDCGTYVTVERAAEDFDEIVWNKIGSIVRDLSRLSMVCKEGGYVPKFDFGQSISLNNPKTICLLMVCAMGFGKPVFRSNAQKVAILKSVAFSLGCQEYVVDEEGMRLVEAAKRDADKKAAEVIGRLQRGEEVTFND